MTVISASSYYPSFKISSSFEIPVSLGNLLKEIWQRHYEELYEEEADGTTSLENAFEKVLDALWSSSDLYSHRRYVWMAYTLALATQPTVEAYLPNDFRMEQVLERTATWLQNAGTSSIPEIHNLFPEVSVGSQAIDEAIDVFRNLQRMTDLEQAREALLEILDNCFEGYAIFPGSAGKRDLFNWWLVEVVPAAWCLQLPNTIYTMKWSLPLAHNFQEQVTHKKY